MANGASKARWSKNTEELTRQDVGELVPRIHATIKRPNVQRTSARLGHGVVIAVGGPVIVRCVMSIQSNPTNDGTDREKGKKKISKDHGTRNRLQMENSGSKICILLIRARDPIVIFRSYRLEQRKINSIPVQSNSSIRWRKATGI